MAQVHDPLWQAPADHIEMLGIEAEKVLAPSDFNALLPGCGTRSIGPDSENLEALVLHKGRLREAPDDALAKALDEFAPTYANEVFVVYSSTGEPLEQDNDHVPSRDWLLDNARSTEEEAAIIAPKTRMQPCYVGQGRVLLETAFERLMIVNGADTGIVPHLIRDGYFDRALTDMIRELLEPGMTFLDIGANFGTYTLIGAQCVGEEGRVVAIEPAKEIGILLSENVAMNGYEGMTDVLNCAVGDEPGRVTLFECSNRQGGNTLLPGVAESAKGIRGADITPHEVDCRRLDEIVESLRLQDIDLIKIDVEGFEYQAFLGGVHAIERHHPRIILEWIPDFLESTPGTSRKLWDLLVDDLGYSLRRIEANATTRSIGFDELSEIGHSDLLAEPMH